MFRLIIARDARRDIDRIYSWWAAERSQPQAAKWYIGIHDAIEALRINPEANSYAYEFEGSRGQFRQMLFGLGRRATHRVIYLIRGRDVIALRVRHVSQKPLQDSDMNIPDE